MDMSGIGGIFSPQSGSDHRREEPPINSNIGSMNNGVADPSSIDKREFVHKTLEPQNAPPALIKVTPPPPRFIQENTPKTAPVQFTVLGAGKTSIHN